MKVSLATLFLSLFSFMIMTRAEVDVEARWYEIVCAQENDTFIVDLTDCYKYVPELPMAVWLECIDRYVPDANGHLPTYFREVCIERSLYSKVDDCILTENPEAMEEWDAKGRDQWECLKTTFAKYEIDFDWPEV